jgi:hypothetical protein
MFRFENLDIWKKSIEIAEKATIKQAILREIEDLCRMISGFIRTLKD